MRIVIYIYIYIYWLYQNIRANDGEYRIEIHKLFSCKNKSESDAEEQKIIIELNANLNSLKAHTTAEEMKEYTRKYNKEHSLKKKN